MARYSNRFPSRDLYE